MLAWFTLRAILLVGDHQQLRPLVFSRPKENPFQSQLQYPC
jgi:superfamily I DNA and/or RNA helicase